MNDAIDPGAKGTALVERRHAPPKLNMHLLQEVGPAVGIRLISSGEARKQWAAEATRLFVQSVLPAAIQRLVQPIVNSRAREGILTRGLAGNYRDWLTVVMQGECAGCQRVQDRVRRASTWARSSRQPARWPGLARGGIGAISVSTANGANSPVRFLLLRSRGDLRNGGAVMTGPAGDVDFIVAELLIDLGDQLNRLAGLDLCGLGVEGAICLMAVVATPLVLQAQRSGIGPHLFHQIFRREHLEILGSRRLAVFLSV